MTSLRSLAKETLIYGLSYSLGRVISFLLVTVYLTRVFSDHGAFFSIYSEIYFFIALCIGILTFRMETTFFRFASDENLSSKIYPLASQLVILGTLIFVACVHLFIKPIENFLQYPDLGQAIIYSAWIIGLDCICSLPFAKLRYKKQAIKYAWIKSTNILINVFLVFLLLQSSGEDPAEKLTLVILANLIASIVSLILLWTEIRESFTKADWSQAPRILYYAFPLVLVTASFIIIQYGGTSLLKYFLPGSVIENLDSSKQYNAALRLAVIMNLFVTAFNYAAEPFFFRHMNQDNSRQVFARLSLYYIICCSAIYLSTCLFIQDLSILLAKNFRQELQLVKILLLANILTGLYANFSSWYKLSDRNLLMAAISISGMVLMVMLNIVLIPFLGSSSAAYASLMSYAFICWVSYYQGQKNYPVPYDTLKMAAYLGSCILLVWIMPFLYSHFLLADWLQRMISLILILLFAAIAYHSEWKKYRQFGD